MTHANGEVVETNALSVPGQDAPGGLRRIEDPQNIMAILAQAVDRGTPPETLERLMALSERISANAAKQKFNEAMAKFKAMCPPVKRRTENAQFKVTRDGVAGFRKYAALEDIEATIRGPLGECGLSYRWTDTKIDNGSMSMVCVVSHVGGHSESSPATLPVNSNAGCSEAQKYGAAMTYAQRYSLIQALGLTTCDEDSDGNEPPPASDPISDDQLANLQALIDDIGTINMPVFLSYIGVKALADIPAVKFKWVVSELERKRKQRGANK